ncbi:GNAT family N-acetyltransferase [Aurantimonas aggregata]|uniref:GNAT family N-acetyltransferase n=1 Tax=Aurantimonas aggregata TaxID=2047720 RepID=A0A6L9MF61_9HYPH|nr:GNAT family N-acetyltransferase [Aurantimonas aggregata]NDV86479.1 GNAT family N-acetyltransferase [Aurantimonas aggregata]
MGVAARPISGRKPFRGMAPKGYRLRMMEPGEAEALLAIRRASAEPDAQPLDMADFIRLILTHEVYVAVAKREDRAVGYAVAGGRGPVYWLVDHRVAADHRGRGVGAALLDSVSLRARWFDHRALALPAPVGRDRIASFYRRLGFMPASPGDLPLRPDSGPAAEMPVMGGPVMVKWV